jgi:hypothetical protein
MSKRALRIILSVLISLAVIAVIYTSVQAAFPGTGARSGGVRLNAGLMPDLNHVRASLYVPQNLPAQVDTYSQPSNLVRSDHHGCGSDFQTDPDD